MSSANLVTKKVAKNNYDIDALDLDSHNTTVESVTSINSNVTDDGRNLKIESVNENTTNTFNDKKKSVASRKFVRYNMDDIDEEPLIQPESNRIITILKNNPNSILIDELADHEESSNDSMAKYDLQSNKNLKNSALNNIKNWNCAGLQRTQSDASNLEIDEYSQEKYDGIKLNIQIVSCRKSKSKKPTNYDLDDILNEEKVVVKPIEARKSLKIESLFEDSEGDDQPGRTPEDILSVSTNSLSIEETNDKGEEEGHATLSRRSNFNMGDKKDNIFEPSTHNWLTNYDQTPVKLKSVAKSKEVNNRKGTEWLREASEKLNQKSAHNQTCLNETSLNETLDTTSRKISPTMLTVNSSSLFLNESDIRKRKIKFIK